MTIRFIDYTFHYMAYYFAWLGAILLAANNHNTSAVLIVAVAVVLQILWQHYIARRTQGLWVMMILFVVSGTLADSILIQLGLIELSANPFGNFFTAPWMSSLWLSFGITFYSLLPSFFNRYLLVTVLSLICFPIAYSAGVALHAAKLPHGYMSSFFIGVVWAILFPVVLKTYHAIEKRTGNTTLTKN
jgi:hypothetical protein